MPGLRHTTPGGSSMQAQCEAEGLLAAVSDEWWTDDPAPTRALLDRLEADLAAGPERFGGAWACGVVRDHSLARIDNPLPPAVRHRLGEMAGRMAASLDALPAGGQGDVTYLCARFREAAGQTAAAIAAGEDA